MEASNLIQLLTNTSIFASAIFIPILAKDLGASDFELGLIISVFSLTYLIASYFFAVLADRYGAKRFLQLGLIASTIFFALQVFAKDTFSLFYLRALAGFAAGIFPAALTVYAFEEREGKMGKFTAYGSLGWAIGSILAGILALYNPIFIVSSVLFLFSFLISFKFEDIRHRIETRFLPWGLFKRNLLIYAPYFLRGVGAHTVWAIFPLYLLSIGADKFWIGIAYFFNAFPQFFMMQYVERFRNLYLFNIGLLCSVVTFITYALLQNFWYVLPIQVLLAFSFSTLQVGAHQELLRKNPEKGSSVGILNSLIHLTAVLGPFLAGAILQFFGFGGVMWFAAAISFIGLISFTKVIE